MPSGNDHIAVQVSGLSHCYSGQAQPALQDIQLQIPAGSCFGLLGPNGAGKTTLLSLLTGLLPLQQGKVTIAGFEYPGQAEAIKACSALVPQEYAFYPSLSGQENLDFFAGLYAVPGHERQARIQQCAALCALESVLGQRAANYSGGLKRRLNIAIGLLCQPQILYLDEPTVGIDAQSRQFILDSIKQLKQQGVTVVYTSHYMEEIEQICDQVAIIDAGRVCLQQDMPSLLRGDGSLFIQPEKALAESELKTLQSHFDCSWQHGQLQINCEKRQIASVLQQLESQGIEVHSMSLGKHRLESVYLAITSRELRD